MNNIDTFFDSKLSFGRYEMIILGCTFATKVACGNYLYLMNVLPYYMQRDYLLTDKELAWLLTSFQVGQFLGGLLLGQTLDKLGRAPSIRGGLGITLLAFGLLLLPFKIEYMTILSIILGIFASFTISAFNTLISEIVSTKRRNFWMVVISVGLSIGRLVGALASAILLADYEFGDWKKAFLVGGLVLTFTFCIFVFVLRESAKYLYTKQRYSELHEVLNEINSFNQPTNAGNEPVNTGLTHAELEELKRLRNVSTQLAGSPSKTGSLLDKKYLYLTLATFLNFSIFFMLMNGHVLTLPKLIGMNTKSLWTNVFIISGEVVSAILCIFIIDLPWVGGRRTILGSSILAAILIQSVQIENAVWLPIAMFFVRVCLKANLVGWSVYTASAFPIMRKGRAFGISMSCGGISNTLFPYLFLALFNWQKYSVLWLMSGLSLVAVIITAFLPSDHDAHAKAREEDEK